MPDDLFDSDQPNDDPYSNVSDWSLKKFQEVYSPDVTKADIWEYMYGVMHAPDWREKFRTELQKNLPRIPLAPGGMEAFSAFQDAGRELFTLHVDYESGPEAEVDVDLDEDGHYQIDDMMRWEDDKSTLVVNPTCRLIGIPPESHEYQISGRSPLEWAVDSLRVKKDGKSGIVDDPNGWRAWEDDPYELIRHLRRLTYIAIRSAEIIRSLPASLPSEEI